eukprot:365795-Chlamydomonas_euryale.AAC.7
MADAQAGGGGIADDLGEGLFSLGELKTGKGKAGGAAGAGAGGLARVADVAAPDFDDAGDSDSSGGGAAGAGLGSDDEDLDSDEEALRYEAQLEEGLEESYVSYLQRRGHRDALAKVGRRGDRKGRQWDTSRTSGHQRDSGSPVGQWDTSGTVGHQRDSGTPAGQWDTSGTVGHQRDSGTPAGKWDTSGTVGHQRDSGTPAGHGTPAGQWDTSGTVGHQRDIGTPAGQWDTSGTVGHLQDKKWVIQETGRWVTDMPKQYLRYDWMVGRHPVRLDGGPPSIVSTKQTDGGSVVEQAAQRWVVKNPSSGYSKA